MFRMSSKPSPKPKVQKLELLSGQSPNLKPAKAASPTKRAKAEAQTQAQAQAMPQQPQQPQRPPKEESAPGATTTVTSAAKGAPDASSSSPSPSKRRQPVNRGGHPLASPTGIRNRFRRTQEGKFLR